MKTKPSNEPWAAKLLFGSIEECKRRIVERINDARIRRLIPCSEIDDLCGPNNPAGNGVPIPTCAEVEADPMLVNSYFLSRVLPVLGLTADNVINPELRGMFRNGTNTRTALLAFGFIEKNPYFIRRNTRNAVALKLTGVIFGEINAGLEIPEPHKVTPTVVTKTPRVRPGYLGV